MQVLKDEIKMSILSSAKDVFMEFGYEKATMRVIAEKAGITVGNLYRYFKNKYAIFKAVINPVFSKIMIIITRVSDENFDVVGFESFTKELVSSLSHLHNNHRDELIIMLKGAKGTKYENIIDHFKSFVVEGVIEKKRNKLNISENTIKYTIDLISSTYIDAIVRLLIEKENNKEFTRWLEIMTIMFYKDIQNRAYTAFQTVYNT